MRLFHQVARDPLQQSGFLQPTPFVHRASVEYAALDKHRQTGEGFAAGTPDWLTRQRGFIAAVKNGVPR